MDSQALGPEPPARLAVSEDDAGRRRAAVARTRRGLPRSLVMKLARTGKLRLNGRRAEAGEKVAAGDVLEVRDARAQPQMSSPGTSTARSNSATPQMSPPGTSAPRPPADLAARIVFEDRDVLLFDKPPGVAAHGGSGHAGGAIDWLVPPAATPGAFRPALVNRLDRDTSGLLILAKSGLALRALNEAVREGRIAKTYVGLVRGAPEPPAGEVVAALRKDRGVDGRERMAVVDPGAPGALPAVTRYRTLERAGGASLVELRPATGRTHQLRVHLAHLGHPIALDPRYGDPDFDRDLRERTGLTRLFLHAARIELAHPRTGAPLAIEAPLAADLAAGLARLRSLKT